MKKLFATALCGSAVLLYASEKLHRATVFTLDNPPPGPRLQVVCDMTCKSDVSEEQKTTIDSYTKVAMDVEKSKCFSEFFKTQDHIDHRADEPAKVNKDVDQVLADLTQLSVKSTLSITRPGLFRKVFRGEWKMCARETNPPDGNIYMKEKCYLEDRDDYGRATTFAHEISHGLGYGHVENNFNKNTMYSVPYTIDRAFEACENKYKREQ
jgi:hypothetical protein